MVSSRVRSYVSISILPISVSLVAVWSIGQILQDRNWWLGLMFYFPTPVLVCWLLLVPAILRTKARHILLMLIAPLVVLLLVENHWSQPSRHPATAQNSTDVTSTNSENPAYVPKETIVDPSSAVATGRTFAKRLIHWNVARGVMGWEKQWQYIQSLRPDIVVISEIPESFDASSMTGFHVLTVDDMAVACHGSMTNSRTLVTGGALDAYHVTCVLSEGPLELMVADMTSHIPVPRDLYLRPFVALLATRKIDVSVGDFNAPRRSLAFCNLPKGYKHAYDEAGAGWSYTWPVPVPCLAIDQCITGPAIEAIQYELKSTMLSDHRMQILDFEWHPKN